MYGKARINFRMVEYSSSYEAECGDVTPSSGAHLKILRTRVVRSGWSLADLVGFFRILRLFRQRAKGRTRVSVGVVEPGWSRISDSR